MSHRICLLSRGSHEQGMGHLHRSMWLREVLLGCGRNLQVEICCLSSAEAQAYFDGNQLSVNFGDWQSTAARLPACDLCVVDWLDSPSGFVDQLRASCRLVALLDDYGPATAEADLVIRSLLSDIAPSHGKVGRAKVLCGIQYLQLSPSIVRLRYGATASRQAMEAELVEDSEREAGPVRSIMLSFGGTAHIEQSQFVMNVLRELEYGGRVLVKPAHDQLRVPPGLDVELHPSAKNFHELLSACDLCVIGGGLTLYEAVFLGVPPVVLPIVPHQLRTARKLSAAGCCIVGSLTGDLNHNMLMGRLMELLGGVLQRTRLIHNGMRLVDGRGIYRTLDALLALLDEG